MRSTKAFLIVVIFSHYSGFIFAQQPLLSSDKLAETLIAAKSPEDRRALLEVNQHALTAQLRKTLTARAFRASVKGDYSHTLHIVEIIRAIGEYKNDKAWLAIANVDSAAVYFLQGKVLQARAAYSRVPKPGELMDEKDVAAHVLEIRGFLGYFIKGYEQALKDCQQSLSLRDEKEDQIDIGFTLNAIGMIMQDQNRFSEAMDFYQRSLKIFTTLDDRMWTALPINNIASLSRAQKDHKAAREYYQKSLALIRQFEVNSLLPYTLNNLGETYFDLGEYDQALEHLEQSLALRRALGDKAAVARSLRNIASVYIVQENFQTALDYLQQSLKLEEELNQKDKIAGRLHDIGYVYTTQSNFSLASEYLHRSLKLAEEINDKEMIFRSLNSLGVMHQFQRNHAKVVEYCLRGLVAAEATGDKQSIIAAHHILSISYAALGEITLALTYLQKALALSHETGDKRYITKTLQVMGSAFLIQKNYDSAIHYLQQSLKVGEEAGLKRYLKESLYEIANAYYFKGEYAQSLETGNRAAQLAIEQNDRTYLYASRLTTGRAYAALKQYDKAHTAFNAAIATVEKQRQEVGGDEQQQVLFFEDKIKPYQEMVSLLLLQNKNNDALRYAERARARALVDLLQSDRFNITRQMTIQEQEQEHQLNGRIVSLNAQITRESQTVKPDSARLNELQARLQEERLRHEEFQTTLYLAHPNLRTQRGDADPFQLEEAAALLPDGKTALLEYVIIDEKTYLFVITRSEASGAISLQTYTLPINGKDLSDKAIHFRTQLAERDLDFPATAKELYALLIKPVSTALKGKTKLVIVPDGALWDLPFQALMSSANRYLIEDCAIAYTPSLTVLREMTKLQRPRNSSVSLLAVGNPALSEQPATLAKAIRRDKLQPLPEAESEVKALAELYGAEQSRIFIGAAARESAFKAAAENYDVLHLATHGVLDDASPMYSSIVFSQTGIGDEDGLLEAREIMKFNLKANLVVLSACETARGRIRVGEGVIGLTWSLFVAGCPTTIVSQWKVDSASTTQLMVALHRNLKLSASPMGKAEALRQAALQQMKKSQFRHPFYWAGFVLVGNGN